MALHPALAERCQETCELCSSRPATLAYTVSPRNEDQIANQVAICDDCRNALNAENQGDHWRCLEGTIWNPEPSVQALACRILHQYASESWAMEVLNSVELDENIREWALSAFEKAAVHLDAFGNTLEQGDTVVLTQNLNVKGTSFTAPKGTVVKKIRLVQDNVEQIEGKINDQVIVILTKYVKKS